MELITAVVAGYDVFVRVASAINPSPPGAGISYYGYLRCIGSGGSGGQDI